MEILGKTHLGSYASSSRQWHLTGRDGAIVYMERSQSTCHTVLSLIHQKLKEKTKIITAVCQHMRHSSVFFGDNGQHRSKWLKGYDGISKFNNWYETLHLIKVYFYFEGTAKKWCENREDNLTSWTVFQTKLQKYFGDAKQQKCQTEERLHRTAHHLAETTKAKASYGCIRESTLS